MRIESQKFTAFHVLLTAALAVLCVGIFMLMPRVHAASTSGERLITIHDRGDEVGLITEKDTLREVFKEADIRLDKNDLVEPAIDEELVGNNYQVNIYRARPVVIVDGMTKQLVMTAYQTPKQIAQHANIQLHDEDEATLELTNDLLTDGASERMTIDRATAVKLTLFGNTETVYTQAETVADFLAEKDISLTKKDTLTVKEETAITAGMHIEIWRNGKQTVTRKEVIEPPVRQIQDADQPVGYRKVKVAGTPGKKLVTYEIVMRNGKEVSKKELQTVIVEQAKEEVVIVGAKPSFGGDFAAALAKLRSCEGGYDSWNPAGPYYGAYQFDQGTWASVSSAPYGNATPAEQDAAARALYERRGWQPWPHCGAGLPDTYR